VKPKRMVPSYGYTKPIIDYDRDTAIVTKFFFLYFFIAIFFYVFLAVKRSGRFSHQGVGNQKSTLQPRSHLVA